MEQSDWSDAERAELRDTIRQYIRGAVRLRKGDHDMILETCREICIDDACPEGERPAFMEFMADVLQLAETQARSEASAWPPVTDCDRLDRAEAALLKRGILLWQVSPCCDTCTRSDLPDRIEVVEQRHPGIRDRIRGYAFFIDQNMRSMLADGTDMSVYLGYGWLSSDNREVSDETYQANALGIAREVCECLETEGLKVDWDGSISRKIGVSLNWQRRTILE